VNLGTFTNGLGTEIQFIFEKGRAAIRKRWMELQDKSLEKTFKESMGSELLNKSVIVVKIIW
jgi:hypothetical protein